MNQIVGQDLYLEDFLLAPIIKEENHCFDSKIKMIFSFSNKNNNIMIRFFRVVIKNKILLVGIILIILISPLIRLYYFFRYYPLTPFIAIRVV